MYKKIILFNIEKWRLRNIEVLFQEDAEMCNLVMEEINKDKFPSLQKADRNTILEAVTQGAPYRGINVEFSDDIEIAREALEHEINHCGFIAATGDALRTNKNFVMEVMQKDSSSFRELPESLRCDKDIICAAVRCNGSILGHVPTIITEDAEFMLELLSRDRRVFRYVDKKLKNDRQFVRQFLDRCF